MTAPLTPIDCDLRDFDFIPLDATRLLDSDLFALATGDEFKAAIALWCKSWTQIPAASLPDDDRVLAHLSGAGSKWKKVKDMALRGFIKCADGRLYHCVVAEKANEAWAKKLSYRERSKKGNSKRWGSQKDVQQQSNSDPLGTSEGVLEPPKVIGNSRELPLDKSNGQNVVSPPDPEKAFWELATGYLGPAKRSVIGKWVKDYGRAETARAIAAAQVERAVDPIPYVERCLRGVANGAQFGSLSVPC